MARAVPGPTAPQRTDPGTVRSPSCRQPGRGVGRGEGHPAVLPGDQPPDRGGQALPPVGRILDGDDRELDHLGAQRDQAVGQLGGLGSGAGDHHAPAGQGQADQLGGLPIGTRRSSSATGPTTMTDGAGRSTEDSSLSVVRTTC